MPMRRLSTLPLEPLRRLLLANVRSLTGNSGASVDFSKPVGDPGWFGPASVSWEVHADFVAMLCGGVRALVMQSLHPRALAGVWDHSNFRVDMQGHLARTALFVASTTFGPSSVAQAAVDRVLSIHAHVKGHTPDGQAYSANDEDLLCWVHVAEVSSFMAAYRCLVEPTMSRERMDRYFDEQSRLALALGARDVPCSMTAVEDYLASMQSTLIRTARTDEVIRLLRHLPQVGLLGSANSIFVDMGFDLLPPAIRRALDLKPANGPAMTARRWALQAAAPTMRWVLQDGISHQARQRCADSSAA